MENRLQNAIKAVRDSSGALSLRAAAVQYNVAPTTLNRRYNGGRSRTEAHAQEQKLDANQEKALEIHLKQLVSQGSAVNLELVRYLGESLRNGGEGGASTSEPLGHTWARRFLKRHGILTITHSEAYKTKNIEGSERGAGVKPFRRLVNPEDESITPPESSRVFPLPVRELSTTRTLRPADAILADVPRLLSSPSRQQYGLDLLEEGLQQAIMGFQLLRDQAQARNEEHRNSDRRKKHMNTREVILWTEDVAEQDRLKDNVRRAQTKKRKTPAS